MADAEQAARPAGDEPEWRDVREVRTALSINAAAGAAVNAAALLEMLDSAAHPGQRDGGAAGPEPIELAEKFMGVLDDLLTGAIRDHGDLATLRNRAAIQIAKIALEEGGAAGDDAAPDDVLIPRSALTEWSTLLHAAARQASGQVVADALIIAGQLEYWRDRRDTVAAAAPGAAIATAACPNESDIATSDTAALRAEAGEDVLTDYDGPPLEDYTTWCRYDVASAEEVAALRVAGDDTAPAVLVARCENYRDAPCTGRIRFRWGHTHAPCDTCGGHCGIAVAAWEHVEPAQDGDPS